MATVSVQNLRKVFAGEDRTSSPSTTSRSRHPGTRSSASWGPPGAGSPRCSTSWRGWRPRRRGRPTSPRTDRRARVGYVFQAPRLLPWRSVMDNMLFVQPEQNDEVRERAARYLDMVGLSEQHKSWPAQLSGGMQQRVGIARAFSIEPDALLMDEPFSHLDAITARGLRRELHGDVDGDEEDGPVRDPRRRRGGRALGPDRDPREGREAPARTVEPSTCRSRAIPPTTRWR